jgi:hypothetical protein
MPISSPEVTCETILQTGMKDLIVNATKYMSLIFANFPSGYSEEATAYLQSDEFDPNDIPTLFGMAYDPAELPCFNIVLAGEGETIGSQHMYVGDVVISGEDLTDGLEEYGSDWDCAVSIIVRAQKRTQCIILYSIVKWLFLKNRLTLERNFIKANRFSGSDLQYEGDKQATFVFSRLFKIDCRIQNTYDIDVSDASTITQVVAEIGEEVSVLPQANVSDGLQPNPQVPPVMS